MSETLRQRFWGKKTVLGRALYALEIEVRHRAHGSVYLRGLGVRPTDFFARPGL